MPIFPLQDVGRVPQSAMGLGLVQGIQQSQRNELLNAASQAQIDEFGLNAPVRQAAREGALDAATAQSLMDGAIQAMPFIQAKDFNGLLNNVQQRRQTIVERGGDTRHTDEVLGLLQSQNVADQQQGIALITAVATQGQTAGEGFTLGQGQTRFGAGGQEIARGQEKPAAGQFAILSEQEKVNAGLDPAGQYQRSPTGQISLVATPPSVGEGENLRRQKINDALRLNPNLSEQQATKVVDGQAKIEINEKTGNLVFTDLITQEVREIPFTTQEPATPTPPTGQSLFDLAGTATGPIQSIAGKVERTRAFLGGEAGEVTEAQQRYKTEIQNMVRALSINPRFPVGEIDRIREEIDIQPSFFQGEEVLKSKLRSIDSSLRVRLAQAEADANNPNLDTETRQNQGSNASSIRNFLTIMGVPQQAEGELESRKQELLNRLEQLRAQ